MSPKFKLWLAALCVASAWYALDPDAGGPFHKAAPRSVAVTDGAPGLDAPIARNH